MLRYLGSVVRLNSLRARPVFQSCRELSDKKCVKCGFYSKVVENKINEQILSEFRAAYIYFSMCCHFSRTDVALPGCEKFFKIAANEEIDHAKKLCNFQTLRGGTIQLMNIDIPDKISYNISDVFIYSVHLETNLTEKLLELKETAQKCDDDVTVDFIVTEFIHDQYKAIQTLNRLVTRLNLLQSQEIGIHLFDKELQESCKEGSNEALH